MDQMQKLRRVHSSAFKAKVSPEAIKETKTIAELASLYRGVHTTQIKQQLPNRNMYSSIHKTFLLSPLLNYRLRYKYVIWYSTEFTLEYNGSPTVCNSSSRRKAFL